MAPTKIDNKGRGDRDRPDQRRQVLFYMRPELIKALKIAATEDETTAYELAERAVETLLKARKRRR
jgi:hypothetical protein